MKHASRVRSISRCRCVFLQIPIRFISVTNDSNFAAKMYFVSYIAEEVEVEKVAAEDDTVEGAATVNLYPLAGAPVVNVSASTSAAIHEEDSISATSTRVRVERNLEIESGQKTHMAVAVVCHHLLLQHTHHTHAYTHTHTHTDQWFRYTIASEDAGRGQNAPRQLDLNIIPLNQRSARTSRNKVVSIVIKKCYPTL